MPSYDPRELIYMLETQKKENVVLIKRVNKLIIEYADLLKEYDKLTDAFMKSK